jgi:hypothetical protein
MDLEGDPVAEMGSQSSQSIPLMLLLRTPQQTGQGEVFLECCTYSKAMATATLGELVGKQ